MAMAGMVQRADTAWDRMMGGFRKTAAAWGGRPSPRQVSYGGGGGRALSTVTAPPKPTLSAGAKTAWEKAIAQYGPEGGFGKGVEAGLERGRTKALASGMQGLVGAGLAGTTMAAGLGKRYEEEVAAPARGRVEEARAQAIANLQAGLASAEQRGYETAEERALRTRLTSAQLGTQYGIAGMQAGTQRAIAGGQTGLGYAQLESRERISSRELAMQEVLAKMKMQPQGGGEGGGYGASYGAVGESYWN